MFHENKYQADGFEEEQYKDPDPPSNSLFNSTLNLQASVLPLINCEMNVTMTQILRTD